MTPLCIIGMHRCGTSLTANILAKSGVNFGSPDELMSANDSNVLGYFEHQELTYEVNDALLSHFDGNWRKPPILPPNWEKSSELDHLRQRALSILSNLKSQKNWGWKDPRTSILLPFWKSLAPQMRYIVCLRNPIDVAMSLKKREGLSFQRSSELWYRYTNDAINHTDNSDRIIVFYDDFFSRTEQAVKRLIEFTHKQEVDDRRIKILSKTIFPGLRHHHSANEELSQELLISDKCKNLFDSARSEFEPINNASDPANSSKNHKDTYNRKPKVSKVPDNPIIFADHENPIVSIIVPTHNRSNLLGACLRSLQLFTDLPYQLIIVNDCSTDNTDALLDKVENADIINNKENLDFLKSANIGAGEAKGKYIVFLNNDVTVRHNWLKHLVDTIDSRTDCGAVGAKLVSMDGKLQEAGCTIWPDGNVTLIGNGDSPFKPEYSYLRETDYCSGACLLVDKKLFLDLGGFDERYSPAYYEDVDLCMAIRDLGKKVLYQPKSVIFHHQMGSRPLEKVLDLLNRNRVIFRKKWQNSLALKSNLKISYSARNNCLGNRILIFGLFISETTNIDKTDSKVKRLVELSKNNYGVTLITDKENSISKLQTDHLQEHGVEVFHSNSVDIELLLSERENQYDHIIYCEKKEHPHISHLIKKYYPKASLGNSHKLIKLIEKCNRHE